MPSIELGGNFCLTKEQISNYGKSYMPFRPKFLGWDDVLFTHGGRSAIIIAVENLGLNNTEVLIPNFSCHSITDAFHACGCNITYYKINRNLTVNIPALMQLIEERHPKMLFTCSLFNVDTTSELRLHYKDIQDKGVKIVEDITHSVLGDLIFKKADVVICSLRKWLEIPDGGFIWGLKNFDKQKFYAKTPEQTDIVKNFIEASKGKLEYFNTKNERLKRTFLPSFYKNNDLFDDCSKVYRMSGFSYDVLMNSNLKANAAQRRENYQYLLDHITNPLVEIIFPKLPDYVVPLYMQVYVHDGQRLPLQKALIKKCLYCPVIWPTPEQITEACLAEDIANHDDMLSLIVDQRYGLEDMEILVENINNFV